MRWYFDFISPFAYLQCCRLQQLEQANGQGDIEFKPVLFAGLLNHWGQLGPAELPGKRLWTFEHVLWLANRDGIELNLPPHHPFNPIPLLRLCIAAGNTREVVERLFRFVWVEGQLPQHQNFADLCSEFDRTPEDINAAAVKQELIDNGELAIADQVFGVPTIVAKAREGEGQQLFWGYDATDMAIGFLQSEADPSQWPKQKIAQAAELPQGVQRKR